MITEWGVRDEKTQVIWYKRSKRKLAENHLENLQYVYDGKREFKLVSRQIPDLRQIPWKEVEVDSASN